VAFPSTGFWTVNIHDAELSRAAAALERVSNEEVTGVQDRISRPPSCRWSRCDAVAELEWAAENGYQSIFCRAPCRPTKSGDWKSGSLWAAAAAHNIVLAYHIGTGGENVVYRGPGGAVVNYMETTTRACGVTHLVASVHSTVTPTSRCLSPKRAGWCRPSVTGWTRPTPARNVRAARLSRLPSEIVRKQSTPRSSTHQRGADHRGHGYNNVMWATTIRTSKAPTVTLSKRCTRFRLCDPRSRSECCGDLRELFTVPPMSEDKRASIKQS